MNVLLIEPDIKLGKNYAEALSLSGFTVQIADGAEEALEFASKTLPNLLLLELQLPRHGGVEFVYEFRSYPEWKDVPIILFTMTPKSALGLDQKQLTRFGIVDYLYKPEVSLANLVASVKEFI